MTRAGVRKKLCRRHESQAANAKRASAHKRREEEALRRQKRMDEAQQATEVRQADKAREAQEKKDWEARLKAAKLQLKEQQRKKRARPSDLLHSWSSLESMLKAHSDWVSFTVFTIHNI